MSDGHDGLAGGPDPGLAGGMVDGAMNGAMNGVTGGITDGVTVPGGWDAWLPVVATVLLLLVYELLIAVQQRRRPQRVARSAHAALREDWFDAVSQQPGSEILAVQTLRNSLMSATMTASTAALALMGAVTLSAPSLQASLRTASGGLPVFTPRLALELVLLALLFASLVASVMAVRYYNHAGFIGGMPVGSAERLRWAAAGSSYVRQAGVLYGWGLRHLILVAPLLAALLHPLAGPPAALVVIGVMLQLDRFGAIDCGSTAGPGG